MMRFYKYFLTATFSISLSASPDPMDCAEIKSDKKRLECFDSIFFKPLESPQKPVLESPRVDKKEVLEKVKETRSEEPVRTQESRFGLSQKQIEELDPKTVSNSIKTNIKKPIKLFTGKYRFELENGQVWESYTALARHQASPFKKDLKVEIEKSQMGSFWIIDISSGKRVKVKRII
jgi:hypothetical protein